MPSTSKDLRSKVDRPDHLNSVVVLTIGEPAILTVGGAVISTFEGPVASSLKGGVRSFSFDRVTNGVGHFSMSLVDPNWIDIEQAILNAQGEVSFQYGYEGNLGPSIKATVVGIELEPFLNYVALNISGLCLGTNLVRNSMFLSACQANPATNEVVTSIIKNTPLKIRRISDFVKDLALASGFKEKNLIIDPTADIPIKDDLFATDDVQKIFNSKGSNLFTFIVRKLLPHAIDPEEAAARAEKERTGSTDEIKSVPFVFYIKMAPNGIEEEFHFHRQDKFKDVENVVAVFNLFSDPDTRVISYKPSFEHMIANITRGSSVFAWTYSPLSGTLFEEFGSVEQSPSAIVPDYYKAGDLGTVPSLTQAVKLLGYTADGTVAKRKAARALAMSSNAPLTADLLLVGDAGYNICDIIDINVNIPFGTSQGNPHSTSNRYMVLGIKDAVEMGVFTTHLQLGTASGSTPQGKKAKGLLDEDIAAGKSEASTKKDKDQESLLEKGHGMVN